MRQTRGWSPRRDQDDRDRQRRAASFTAGRIDALSLYKRIGYDGLCHVTIWLLRPSSRKGRFRLSIDYVSGWQSAFDMLTRHNDRKGNKA